MKKFLTWATMFALVVGFSACGGGDDETTPPGTGEGGQTPNPNPGTEVVDKFVNKAKSKNGLTIAATHNFVEVSNDAKPTTIEFAVFNKDGTPVFNGTTDGIVRDMKISDTAVYFLKSKEVVRISTSTGSVARADTISEKARIMVFSDGRVAFCTQTTARYISFD
jgi:hypothetical protein